MKPPRLSDEQIDTIMAKIMPIVADPESPEFESMSAIMRLKLENSTSIEAAGFVKRLFDFHERLQAAHAEKNSLAN